MSGAAVPTAFLDGIGLGEMLVIAFLCILVFGGRLPEVLRNLGRGYAKFRQGLHDMSRPIREEIQSVTTLPALREPPGLPVTGPPEAAPSDPRTAYDVAAAPGGAPPPPPPEGAQRPWPTAPARDPFEEPPPV